MGKTEYRAHYGVKHRVVSWVSQHLFDRITYTCRHGLLTGLKRRGGLGFVPEFAVGKSGDTPEIRYWRDVDLRGKVVYDVGAFQGLLTMHFARSARLVVAYEPNPVSRARLMENLSLNRLGEVVVRPSAVGASKGEIELVVDTRMPGGASGARALSEQTARSAAHTARVTAPVTTLDLELDAGEVPPPDFIKIDVEGLELEVLKGAQMLLSSRRPVLFIEMHGADPEDKLRNARKVLERLEAAGYNQILHLESGQMVLPGDAARAMTGHLVCSRRSGSA